jgi:GNAT superfamily N-acetyltransferase
MVTPEMIPVTIRAYKDSDFPRIHRLGMADGHEPYRSAVFMRQMGIICRNTFLVATLDEGPVGYTIGCADPKKATGGLDSEDGYPGDQRRNGVGSILLAELLEVFSTLGVRTVRLTVSPWNGPALGFCLKMAFEQESYHEAYFVRDEDRIVMVREI